MNLWSEGYNRIYYPLSAFVDLGAEYQLSEIAIFDTNGTGDFRVEFGVPFAWKPLVTDSLNNYQEWNRHPVIATTRYLRFIVPGPETRVPEVAIFGKKLRPATGRTAVNPVPAPKVAERVFPLMDNLIGTNAFIDDPIDKMMAVNLVREYHNWSWDAGDGSPNAPAFPNNQVAFNPSYGAGGNSWFFDDFYARLKAAGITVFPAVQGSVNWLTPKNSDTPAATAHDAANPASYRAHADYMFQFAARYGSRKVADAKLKLAPNQPRRSGLNLLHYFENANEPDAWWNGRSGYSTPYELAARTSADYDGHQKSLGDTFGVKNADPNAQLVLGGLAEMNVDYLRAMKVWADWNRGGDFPADVINVHHYSNDSGDQGESKIGISPESDGLRARLEKLVAYRNRYLPTKKLWLTEFGYDTQSASVQRAPALASLTAEDVQAAWLVRSTLLIAAAGADGATQYMLRDADPKNPTRYSSSGLVTQKGEWKPKASWYYLYTLKNRLAGMRFAGEIPSGNPRVSIFKFKTDSGKGAYAIWCPTSEDARVAAFALPVGRATTASQIKLQRGEKSGVVSNLGIVGGKVKVDVSETALFVLVNWI